MVDPATIVGGFVLLKKSIDGIKSAIGSAKDVGDIASDLDNFFNAKTDVEKKAAKKDRLGLNDQLGIKSVAQEIIQRKQAAEYEVELANLLNLRFGPGTFAQIKQERARRIKEAKQKSAAHKTRKRKEKKRISTRHSVNNISCIWWSIYSFLNLRFNQIPIIIFVKYLYF